MRFDDEPVHPVSNISDRNERKGIKSSVRFGLILFAKMVGSSRSKRSALVTKLFVKRTPNGYKLQNIPTIHILIFVWKLLLPPPSIK